MRLVIQRVFSARQCLDHDVVVVLPARGLWHADKEKGRLGVLGLHRVEAAFANVAVAALVVASLDASGAADGAGGRGAKLVEDVAVEAAARDAAR